MSEYNIQMNKYNALNAEYDQLYPATKIENVDGLGTALQNNDPRQWGLGSTVAPKVTDLNTVFSNGWYRTSDGDAVNYPTTSDGQNYKYGWLFVTTGFYTRQDYYANTTDPMHFIRYYVDGNWSPWEIENPPMFLGKEYRTTERYLGKPVYALCENFGANIDGSSMYFGKNVLNIVRGQAFTGQGINLYPWYNGNTINNWTAFFDFEVLTDTSDNIQKVKVTCRASSGASNSYSTNYVVLHYTKSTD